MIKKQDVYSIIDSYTHETTIQKQIISNQEEIIEKQEEMIENQKELIISQYNLIVKQNIIIDKIAKIFKENKK